MIFNKTPLRSVKVKDVARPETWKMVSRAFAECGEGERGFAIGVFHAAGARRAIAADDLVPLGT